MVAAMFWVLQENISGEEGFDPAGLYAAGTQRLVAAIEDGMVK